MNELSLTLHKDGPTPLFEQLYTSIKSEIIDGRLSPNEKLPSKRRMAENLRCSQNTIQAAYHQLADEGFIEARARSGYYVAELDGILSLKKEETVASRDQQYKETYTYDFSYQGVDFECFPFKLWRKLTREVINDYDKDLLKTGDPQGNFGLRTGIARYLRHSRNVQCTPEQIVVSSGTEYLMQLLIQLFDASCIYGIENPGYEKLNMVFGSNRVAYEPVSLDEHGMIPEALERSCADVACITPSHQFPTGCIMPVSRRIQLLNWAYERPGRYIVEDDYDSEFRYAGKPIPSLQGLDRQGRVIYIGAFSKPLSPALRISYMVLPEPLVRLYREKLNFYMCPVPIIEQKTLQRFIDEGHFERHINRVRNLYRQKREALVAAINALLPGADIRGASAGLHLTLRMNNGMHEGALIEKARAHGIKVYGLSRYLISRTEKDYTGALLLGYATLRLSDITKAITLLQKAWTV